MILKKGDYLFKEGDFCNSLFIVRSGELRGRTVYSPVDSIYGPGSVIGETSLLQSLACQESVWATEDCELQPVDESTVQQTLQGEPDWLKKILKFLVDRFKVAKENKVKSDRIKVLPSLLYLLTNDLKAQGTQLVSLDKLTSEVKNLFNINRESLEELLQQLQDLDILRISDQQVQVDNIQVVEYLYQALLYRVTHKGVSPLILSITEQSILAAVESQIRASHEIMDEGKCTIANDTLKEAVKAQMHGMTLTYNSLKPLIQRNLLQPNYANGASEGSGLDDIESFECDIEQVFNLMELNRIYPQLDKKLVNCDG